MTATSAWMIRSRSPSLRRLSSSTSTSAGANNNNNNNSPNGDRLFPEDLNIIYDSKCNVCKLEIDFLRRRDRRVNPERPRLRFTDLEKGGDDDDGGPYDPHDPANGGVDYAGGMSSMKGVTADGDVLSGVPVFRRAYGVVGLGWAWTVTRWPVMSWIVDRLYDAFARVRTRLTRGGVSVERLVRDYEAKRTLQREQRSSSCDTGTCNGKP